MYAQTNGTQKLWLTIRGLIETYRTPVVLMQRTRHISYFSAQLNKLYLPFYYTVVTLLRFTRLAFNRHTTLLGLNSSIPPGISGNLMILVFILPEVHNIVLHGLRVGTGLAVQSGTPEI